MSVIRMPANLILPERTNRRSLLKSGAALGAGIGAASLFGSVLAQHDEHAAQGSDSNYPGSDGTTDGTGDATPGPGAEIAPFKRYDPVLQPVEPGDKEVTIVFEDKTIWIDKKTQYAAWTMNGTVPGAPLRAVQGDTVHVKVENRALMTHNVDFHAARVAPERGYALVQPGDSFEWDMEVGYPGAFMVHCGTAPMLVHIAAGMYLPMIVDPVNVGFAPAHELVLNQSEFYTLPGEDGIHVTDSERLFELTAAPNITCFNGHASQYVDEPIEIPVGELVRIYMINHGPNVWSSFHVVGAIFQSVYMNANPKNRLEGLQTISVGPGDGVAVEFLVDEPGDYVAVNHSFGHAAHGAIAVLRAS